MVDKLAELISFVGHNFIGGSFITILIIIIFKVLFKKNAIAEISLNIIKWIIILYSFGALLSYLLLYIFPHSEKYAFLERATGPYAWAYWIMFIMNCVIPLSLINKRIGKNIYIVFFLTLLMNIGWVFESLVLHITSFHRDYTNDTYNPYLPNSREITMIFKGFAFGLVILIISDIINKWKTRNN